MQYDQIQLLLSFTELFYNIIAIGVLVGMSVVGFEIIRASLK